MQEKFKSIIKNIHFNTTDFLLSLTLDKVGEGSFQDCENTQFQQLQTEKENIANQFYLQEQTEQKITQNSIKTAPFNTFINFGLQKGKNGPNKHPPNLTIIDYKFVYGFNQGIRTLELIKGRLCRAVGVNIFFDLAIYPSQNDIKQSHSHNYQICYLKYHSEDQYLYSGSQGKSGEIIQWKVVEDQQNVYFNFQRKFNLPLNSLGVFFVHLKDGCLYCITQFSIHKQSQLFIFDTASSKRTKINLQLGKVINAFVGQYIYLINQNGFNILQRKQGEFQLKKLSTKQILISASTITKQDFIVFGYIDGHIELFQRQTNLQFQHFQPHEAPIISVQFVNPQEIISVDYTNLVILSGIDHKKKVFVKRHSILMTDACHSILICLQYLYYGSKNGKIEKYKITPEKVIQKINDQMQQKIAFGDIYQKDNIQSLTYNKSTNKYFYTWTKSKGISVMQIDENGQLLKNDLVFLQQTPHVVDAHSTLIAYIDLQTDQKIKRLSHSSLFKTKTNEDQKFQQYLVLQDYITHKVVFSSKQLEFSAKCTCLQFNPDGDRLALGLENGTIIIYNTNDSKNPYQICRSAKQSAALIHQTPIQSIIWSNDGKYLKTISSNNLLFSSLQFKCNNEFSMVTLDNKKNLDQQALKNGISKASWTQMGKFNWKNTKIWSRANYIEQYTQIKESKKYLFACMQNGQMRVYNNPADQDKYFQLAKWFSRSYKCEVIENEQGSIILIIYGNGMIFSAGVEGQ